MDWVRRFIKKARNSAKAYQYPSQTYKKVLCTRKHCTDSCHSTSPDPWRFWALFISAKKPDLASFLEHVTTLPRRLRFAVYLKCLGLRPLPKRHIHNPTDKELTAQILEFCATAPNSHPRKMFLIVNALSKNFTVNLTVIKLTNKILQMDGATSTGTFGILYALFSRHGLSEVVDPKTSSPEPEGLLPVESIRDVWEILLTKRQDIFIFVTDLVIALGCTYRQLLLRAFEVSGFTEPLQLAGVLGGRKNIRYYTGEYVPEKEEVKERYQEEYFDFLIIQNELIKAQENIKMESSRKNRELEDENIKLKVENQELRNKIAELRGQVVLVEGGEED